jgi:hypothetical protein
MRVCGSLVLALTLGCSGNMPTPEADVAPANSSGASALPSDLDAARDPAIARRLATDPLSGLVVAHPRARLFATEAAARASTEALVPLRDRSAKRSEPTHGSALRVLQDRGAVLKVSTAATSGFDTLDKNLELELFVRRDALLPVLARPLRSLEPDGTGAVLLEGTVLLPLATGVRPAGAFAAAYVAAIDADDVKLSFTLGATPLELEPLPGERRGEELGCDRDNVESRRSLVERDRKERQRRDGGSVELTRDEYGDDYAHRCRLSGTHGASDAPLLVGDRTLGMASEFATRPCVGDVWAVRASDDPAEAFVTFELPRAIVRTRTKTTTLAEAGVCGVGSSLAPRPFETVKHGAVATFPSGARAGVHQGEVTKFRELGTPVVVTTTKPNQRCIQPPYLDEPLCFDPTDIVYVRD